jgi:hypothetical protein
VSSHVDTPAFDTRFARLQGTQHMERAFILLLPVGKPALCIIAYLTSIQSKYARSCCRLLDGEVPEHEFQPSPFFAEQLCAFELWLDAGSQRRRPPEQLPIVLQASADMTPTRRYDCTQ